MYLPKPFQVYNQDELLTFISTWSFGQLITSTQGRLTVSHLPFLLDRQHHVLYAHLARQNPQCEELETADDLLISFNGPHAYVSPNWYTTAEIAPTWNFQTVQVRGRAERLENDQLLQILDDLTQKHEAPFDTPWSIDKLSSEKRHALLGVIVGFRITLDEFVGKFKLSQNRSREDQLGVITGLEGLGDDMAVQIAQKMRANLTSSET